MAQPSPLTYLPLWEHALDKEIGIRFCLSGMTRHRFVGILYAARKKAKNPVLDELMIFQPAAPYDNEVWICKKEVRLEEADAPTT